MCCCGREYSTYPALHLHFKNKHKNQPFQYTKPKKIKRKGKSQPRKTLANWEERMIGIFQEIKNQEININ